MDGHVLRGGGFTTCISNSRHEDLIVLQQMKNANTKTQNDLNVMKQMKLQESNEHVLVKRHILPEFVPQPSHMERRTKAVIQEPVKSKELKIDQYLTLPAIPAYSPLDLESNVVLESRSRKYPYVHKKLMTTEEMKKPHTSSLGVIPIRSSSEIPNLRVILEGVPVPLDGAEVEPMLYNTPAASFIIPKLALEEVDSDGGLRTRESEQSMERKRKEGGEKDKKLEEAPSKKPAILPGVGTTVTVKLVEREKAISKPSYLHRHRKQHKSARTASRPDTAHHFKPSSLSREISFTDGDNSSIDLNVGSDDVETAIRVSERVCSQSSKDGSVLSVEELLDEAKRISSAGADPIFHQRAVEVKDIVPVEGRNKPKKKQFTKSNRPPKSDKKSIKEEKDPKTSETKFEDVTMVKRGERTVDEIIASLRDQSAYNIETEADRKIKLIMNRVMSRTNAKLATGLEDKEVEEITSIGETEKTAAMENEFQVPSDDLELAVNSAPTPDLLLQKDESLKVDSDAMAFLGALNNAVKDSLGTLDPKAEEIDKDCSPVIAQTTVGTQAPVMVPVWMEELMEAGEQDKITKDKGGEEEIIQTLNIQQAWEDLLAPPEATPEDILFVYGEMKEIQQYKTPVSADSRTSAIIPSISLLSTWAPVGTEKTVIKPGRKFTKNIHHFCCMTMDYQLPQSLMHIGRKYHVPDRFPSVMPDQPYRFQPEELAPYIEDDASTSRSCTRIEEAADRVLQEANKTREGENDSGPSTLLEWQNKANSVIGDLDLSLYGETVPIRTDETQVYWNPAPPKLGAEPHIVKELLFSQYCLEELDEFGQVKTMTNGDEESDSSESEEEDIISPEDKASLERTLLKRHNSTENLTNFSREKGQAGILGQTCEVVSMMKTSVADADSTTDIVDGDDLTLKSGGQGLQAPGADQIIASQTVILQKRPQTAPNTFHDGEVLPVSHDFNTVFEEIREQKRLLDKAKKQMQAQESAAALPEIEEQQKVLNIPAAQDVDILAVVHERKTSTETLENELTVAEKALQAGRKYVILPKKKRKKRRGRKMDIAKIEAVEKLLMTKTTKKLERWESMPKLNKVVEREMRVPWKIRFYRPSVPNLLNFEEYKTRKRMPVQEDEREWVRRIWNKWFDIVFPPTPEESDEDDANFPDKEAVDKAEDIELNGDTISDILSENVTEIDPILNTTENKDIYQAVLHEIEKLNGAIDGQCKLTAFDFCRRGALYRKIGQLKKAELDLDRAIQIEPELLDAYWHRHLLYILQDRKASAIDDLNFILKKNKHHSGAYRSMAEIYKHQSDTTMAIINYSSAIKFNPLDHEAYFQRAQMYEQRGDMLLAMEDYAKAMKIMPSRTDIIMKHGMYYFQNENWQSAINDFTELLKVDSLSAVAHLFRGQAYVKMNKWVPAVQDFSAAIHLDPQSWQALYMRACILRKAHPKRALQDFSVSLLLNDSEINLLSYLHRGILYNALGKPDDAIADFKSALKLNKNLALVHVNLGLIYMTKQSNYHRAIEKFTSAISVDPTYIRAYVCRAEAYHKTREVKKALKDYTRAIHLRPDVHHYYMYRGQLLLELRNLELAAFCVHHASEIGMDNPASTFGRSPTQQAVVQSFLKNYDKAVNVLSQAVQAQPVASHFMLLGKTHMKTNQFKEAVTSFKQALDIMKPWNKNESWPPETADAHYLTGVCYMELRDYSEALQQFNLAIKCNPTYADAYYQRGLASVKVSKVKGILDFNRALALDPKMFQAYLSRACYYGMKGKYAKAILNCNETIKLQPKSLRAYLYRGALKYHIKAYELAILDLTKASSIDAQCPLPYFNRAVCYHQIGQFEKALTDYSIVLLLGDMLRLKVLINRGLLYFEAQDYRNALSDFQAAANISPSDHTVLHTLGICFHKLNCLKEAVAVFTRCLRIKPFYLDGFIARGNAFMDYRNDHGLQLAKRDYQRVLHLDPMCLAARINLAYAAQMSGKLMQAWKHFTSIIEVKPSYKSALEGRAIVNLQMSNTFGAFQDISQSINYGPTAELLTNRGVISQFMGDRVMAMKDYQRAIKLDSTYSLAYYNAGNVYFHTRHFKQALEYYSKATLYNPMDDSAFLNCAITKVLLHDIQGALADFDNAAKLSPYSAHIFFNRANLYASLQQYEMAEKEYTKALKLKPDDALMLKRRADVRGKLGRQTDAIDDYKRAVDIQTRPHKLIKTRLPQV